MAINIPKPARKGFYLLAELTEEQFQDLISGVKQVPVGSLVPSIPKHLKADSIDRDILNAIGRTAYSFGGLLDKEGANPDEIAKEVLESYESDSDNRVIPDDKKSILKNRLHSLLLASENIKKTYKAAILAASQKNNFKSGRIITDLRLLFSRDINPSDEAIIIHNLMVVYEDNNEEKNVFFYLDRSDLESLKSTIERAIEKDDVLRGNKDMKIIDIG